MTENQNLEHKARDNIEALLRQAGWDNAATESWLNSFKNERVNGLRYETRAEMAAMSFEYIKVLYNREQQHSTLGYKSQMRFLNTG